MGDIKYGWVEGPGKGREYKLAASQYFSRLGGKFVSVDTAGNMVLATAVKVGSALAGWAETGKHTTGYNAWLSSATAGADKVFVITGLEDKFVMPVDISVASANATLLSTPGGSISISGSTYTTIQQFAMKATAASCNLLVEDYDQTNQTVVVRLMPDKRYVL